ncbi:MAG: hypothetical protein WBA45_12305 [Microthrixaceae bacterium]
MAKYDPKRPRPTVGDDQAAPVEALIEAASVGPDPVEDRAEGTTVVTEAPSPSEKPASASPAPAASDESQVGEPTTLPDDPVKTTSEMGELGDSLHISDVPVIPPPEEGTANRAVLAAIGTGFVITLVLAVLLKWRRKRS